MAVLTAHLSTYKHSAIPQALIQSVNIRLYIRQTHRRPTLAKSGRMFVIILKSFLLV